MTERPLIWSAAITVVVATIVAVALLSSPSPWAVTGGLVATAAWPVATVLLRLGRTRIGVVLAIVGVLAGSLAGGPSVGLSLVAAAVCAMLLIARPEVPVWIGPATALVGVVLICGGIALLAPHLGVSAMLTMSLGLVVGVLGGFVRRAARRSAEEAERLREERVIAREAEGRMALARDLHDVLAHSLGGLTVQLDAIDALLEADRVDEARVRSAQARKLAAQGLADARGAVAALRQPQTGGLTATDPSSSIDNLVAAHRALGAAVDVATGGAAHPVPAMIATAIVRAVQESLSNVRRHAPGAAASVRLDWMVDRVTLRVSNPLPDEPRPRGGGYGLIGMGERFAALPFGGSLRAGAQRREFVVEAEAMLQRRPEEEESA